MIASPFKTRRVAQEATNTAAASGRPDDGAIIPMRVIDQAPPALRSPSGRGEVRFADHPIGRALLTRLRDPDTPPQNFRQACQKLLLLLVLEATRSLPSSDDAPMGKPVVLLSLAREGLGMAHQLAEFVPGASVGVISLDGERRKLPEARLHLIRAPALSEARVILFDPVVATGLSASLALELVRRSGGSDAALVSFVVSGRAIPRLQSADPHLNIWTAAVDDAWDAKAGPMPGIGKFAERIYG